MQLFLVFINVFPLNFEALTLFSDEPCSDPSLLQASGNVSPHSRRKNMLCPPCIGRNHML